jgi:hypothetical protein
MKLLSFEYQGRESWGAVVGQDVADRQEIKSGLWGVAGKPLTTQSARPQGGEAGTFRCE